MVNWRDWVVINPSIMSGKPVIKGTRITVELILEKLAAGESVQDLVKAHPRLSQQAIQAALMFAADVIRGNLVYTD